MNPYRIPLVVLASGERIPVLCDTSTGLPLFAPTLYSLTELRQRGLAAATLEQALRSVLVMQLILNRTGVDLDTRLREGRLLDMPEVDTLAADCRRSMAWLTTTAADTTPTNRRNVISLEASRMRRKKKPDDSNLISDSTACIRLFYIGDYLRWRLDSYLLKIGQADPRYAGLSENGQRALKALSTRIPESRGRNAENQREAMSPEARRRLEEIIDPNSPLNPWKDAHTRIRNQAIIQWLLALGVRSGELLGVTVRDISSRSNEVFIARRPDNPNDPRPRQPLTKTMDRLLEMNEPLANLTHKYIVGARRSIKGARRHDFVFVASKSGAPLSYQALAKSLATLRNTHPDLFLGLTAHVLRHSWNEDFSDMADEANMDPEREKKLRSRLMGWSETSGTAATYNRRHIRRKANDALRSIQQKVAKKKQDGDKDNGQ